MNRYEDGGGAELNGKPALSLGGIQRQSSIRCLISVGQYHHHQRLPARTVDIVTDNDGGRDERTTAHVALERLGLLLSMGQWPDSFAFQQRGEMTSTVSLPHVTEASFLHQKILNLVKDTWSPVRENAAERHMYEDITWHHLSFSHYGRGLLSGYGISFTEPVCWLRLFFMLTEESLLSPAGIGICR